MTSPVLVRADVVDLVADQPRRGEEFFVDTNVWIWYAYPPAGMTDARKRQMRPYMAYLQKVRSAGGRLKSCAITLTELANTVERIEYEDFAAVNGMDTARFKQKHYRYDYPLERQRVAEGIADAWASVVKMASVVEIKGDVACLCSVASGFAHHLADSSDAFIAQTIKKAGMTQVVSDDRDFATFDGLTVFTANSRVLVSARDVGRLVCRSGQAAVSSR